MNDRLRIASEQLASMQHMDRADRVRAALEEADALLAAAGEQDDPALHEDCVGVAVHNLVVDRIQSERDAALARAEAAEARTADLQSKLDEAISRAIDAEASAADWRRISDLREHDIADLRIKFSAAARLARETAGEAMAVAQGKTCVWTLLPNGHRRASCDKDSWAHWRSYTFCPACGGKIKKEGE